MRWSEWSGKSNCSGTLTALMGRAIRQNCPLMDVDQGEEICCFLAVAEICW